MKFGIPCKWPETLRRIWRNPLVMSFLISLSVVSLLIVVEIALAVDKEVIAISITGIIGFLGYFITHYLERERKRKEEKFALYTKLMSTIRVMTTTAQDKTEAAQEFAQVYYTSYLYISTAVYEILRASLKRYQIWTNAKSDENLKAFNERIKELMQAMRDEITPDIKTDFESFDIQFKK